MGRHRRIQRQIMIGVSSPQLSTESALWGSFQSLGTLLRRVVTELNQYITSIE
jgi:hypothetical protein